MGKIAEAIKALERMLPEGASMAEQVALRENPEKYAEYLKTLDKAYGPREQRLKDIGFGKRDWYHGTTVDIPEFKKEAQGLSTGAQSAKKGFFFAEDPSTAADYADLARDKGIIREGDNVTTKWLSDTHADPEKLDYQHYQDARNKLLDAQTIPQQNEEAKKAFAAWEKQRKSPEPWVITSAQRQGYDSAEKYIEAMLEKIKSRRAIRPPASEQEISALKNEYHKAIAEFAKSNDPDYVDKIFSIDMDRKLAPDEKAAFENARNLGRDLAESQGQQVGKYRLKGQPHVKNYLGESYRDTTYADEMAKAQGAGKDSVLFKNTYDPGDPNNRVRQDIAAVFEPNQIRSTNAAFDPRFKDSPYLLAGVGALPAGMTAKEQMNPLNPAKEIASGYKNIKDKILTKFAGLTDLDKRGDEGYREGAKELTGAVLDPTNLIDGFAGPAIQLGADYLAKDEPEKKKWDNINNYLGGN